MQNKKKLKEHLQQDSRPWKDGLLAGGRKGGAAGLEKERQIEAFSGTLTFPWKVFGTLTFSMKFSGTLITFPRNFLGHSLFLGFFGPVWKKERQITFPRKISKTGIVDHDV